MSKRFNKILMVLIAFLVILTAAYVLLRVFRPTMLNKPESIAYDSIAKRFLISNVGNGKIISRDEKGHFKVFVKKGLKSPRGMKIISTDLYVTDDTKVQVINIKTAKIIKTIPIPGSKMLNDIESDHKGKLYISDTKANRLFIYDPATKKVESVQSELLIAPNGIVYDYPRKQMLIVCLSKSSPILSYNIVSKEFATFRSTLYDNLDGIAIDDLGRIYFSSWGESAVFQIPQEQNRTNLWQSDINSPADIYYHQPTNEILVPQMLENAIKRFKVD